VQCPENPVGPGGSMLYFASSFVVNCADQNEIDAIWEKLSAVAEAEQCEWLKDRYGLSWQIVPGELSTMMKDPDPDRVHRVTRAFLEMKKLDLALLQEAYDGR